MCHLLYNKVTNDLFEMGFGVFVLTGTHSLTKLSLSIYSSCVAVTYSQT